ncbi:LysR family transcriptional regulator [Labrys monachus]|uniref:LysR family nitrogen assimilation transcriptional regulator n=1 Tax=Labrys monachus TaxID=217067 RepID=A0ABU0FK22_9HYPH|nr:LysR family transcriptional regulator [Labrys monachus]MDQ0394831.1 LysR family nitrogen assimilation transcriptional regulator [Labrys monachus]
MNTATIAMALAVLQEGSVRGAGRLLGCAPSTVADALERFEAAVAMTLAHRAEGGLTLTLAGETLLRASPGLLAGLVALAAAGGAPPADALGWAARDAVPLPALARFGAVAKAGSIRRAARTLGLGQPHLSRQMSRLEAAFGSSLLRRTSEGCEPTPAGLKVEAAAQLLVEAMAALTAPAGRRFARDRRSVAFGTVAPIGHESRLAARLATLVSDWRRQRAGQDLLVSSTTAEELMAGLLAGRFDAALTDAPMRHRRFESRELFSSELVLVGPRDVVGTGTPLQALLAARPIAVPSLRSGLRQRIREILDPLTERGEAAAGPIFEIDALPIIVNLVLDHGCLTVLPLDSIASLGHKIGHRPLPGAPRIGFHLVWPRTMAAKAVAGIIEASLAAPAAPA